jgi:hypothetical protein
MKQITLRLPDELHAALKAAAGQEHRSVHAQVLTYVERGLAEARDDRKNQDRKTGDST